MEISPGLANFWWTKRPSHANYRPIQACNLEPQEERLIVETLYNRSWNKVWIVNGTGVDPF